MVDQVRLGANGVDNFKLGASQVDRVYLAGDLVFEFNIVAPDIQDFSHNGNSYSVLDEGTKPQDVFIKPDGLKMYVGDSDTNVISQYAMSVAYDVTSAGATPEASFNVSAQLGADVITGVFFKPDGTKMFVVGTATNDIVYEYDLSTAWDVSSASYSGNSFDTSAQVGNPQGLAFGDSGSKMYVTGAPSAFAEYDLTTPWTFAGGVSFNQAGSPPDTDWAASKLITAVRFNDDGTRLFLCGRTVSKIFEYECPAPWRIGTLNYTAGDFLDVSTQETLPTGIHFEQEMTQLFIVGQDSDAVYEYELILAGKIANNFGYTAGGQVTNVEQDVIDRFAMASSANAADVGDLTVARQLIAGQSSLTHGYCAGGFEDGTGASNITDRFQFTASANATDVGDLAIAVSSNATAEDKNYGYSMGGFASSANTDSIQRLQFVTTVNASAIGTLTSAKRNMFGISGPDHGYSAGGITTGGINEIERFAYGSAVSSADVGDLTSRVGVGGDTSLTSGGCVAGGEIASAEQTTIDRFLFTASANATDVGDLSAARGGVAGHSSDSHGYVSGGRDSGTIVVNIIERFAYSGAVTVADVGDLSVARGVPAGFQN